MKWLGAPVVLLFVACTGGQPSYVDRVSRLAPESLHPKVAELLPLLQKPDRDADDLLRTWKEYLGKAAIPLRQDTRYTFVYYDFTHTMSEVGFEATFAPGRRDTLVHVSGTSLFYAVYDIPRPKDHQYRFVTTTPRPDPFDPVVTPGTELWQPVENLPSADPVWHWVTGASEPELGQDLRLLLPPRYGTDLAAQYPLVVLVGFDEWAWTQPLEQMMREESMQPVIVVSVGSPAGLKALLEDHVVPWVRAHYRASTLATDLVLVGWGAEAKAVQDLASARPDSWPKVWTPTDQATSALAWNALSPPFLRSQFPVVTP